MAGSTLDNLLDPLGDTLKDIARGRRGAGRLQVTALWPQIERALDAGATVTMVWEALNQQGLVSVKLRGFSKAVKARREGPRTSGKTATPAAEPSPFAQGATSHGGLGETAAPASPCPTGPGDGRSGIPDRPWRKGPRIPPDPNAVFRPRDPLADD